MFTTQTLQHTSYQPVAALGAVPAAGVQPDKRNGTVKDALTWEERPDTPAEMKKYRQTKLHEPGRIVRHFGAEDDPLPQGPFGQKTQRPRGETAEAYLKTYPDTEVGRWQLETREQTYASTHREPLGKSWKRGHNIPCELGTSVPFGRPVNAREKEEQALARKTIFPVDSPVDDNDPQTHALYLKSHLSYGPGEQRQRGYNWQATGVDPATHRFGAVVKEKNANGVKKALNSSQDEAVQKLPAIVNRALDNFQYTSKDTLGKPKLLGAGDRSLPQDHVFGAPSLRKPEPGVGDLLSTGYSVEEQQPDGDLGKSLREGWRNTAPEDRAFGVPTIRTDLPAPKSLSVSNTQNFGNEPDARQLLHPTQSAVLGVGEAHYLEMRSRGEIADLVAAADLTVTDEELAEAFALASEHDGHPERCCLDTFMRARHYVLARNAGLC